MLFSAQYQQAPEPAGGRAKDYRGEGALRKGGTCDRGISHQPRPDPVIAEKQINVVDIKPDRDKQSRLISQIDLLEGGSVLLPKHAPWLSIAAIAWRDRLNVWPIALFWRLRFFSAMKMPKRSATKPSDSQVTEATSYGPPATGSVKSAGRVLRILEFFDEIQREARVAEIAERLSFPQSSTSILLNCLVDLGFMDYLPESRSFLPSPRVTLLGTWLDKGPVRNGSLIRMLEEISQKTGDTVIIAARNGIFSQYIHVLQARSAMRFHVPHGTRRLVVWSATGFALLTRSIDPEIRALCTRTNAEAAAGQPRVEINQVLKNIQQTRRDGYFFSTGLVTPGAGSIAVPLPDSIDGRSRALTVAVSGILDDIARREKDIVVLLHEVAQRYLNPTPAA